MCRWFKIGAQIWSSAAISWLEMLIQKKKMKNDITSLKTVFEIGGIESTQLNWSNEDDLWRFTKRMKLEPEFTR